jgi:hypothetical protein
MLKTSLFIKSIAKLSDKNGNPYYQLILNKLKSVEIESHYDALFIYPEDEEVKFTVFKNSGYVQVSYFIDIDTDDPITGQPGVKQPINLLENFYDIEAAYIVCKKYHLYTALEAGEIYEGFWLSGEIIKRRVKPYGINGKTAQYYTIPMLWDELSLTDEQKEIKIAREFAWKGRPIVDESDIDSEEDDGRNWNYYNNRHKPPRITNADAFDDPSDYWNID